jgi:hypothetical protein
MQSNWPVDEDAIRTPSGCGYIIDIEREEIVGDIVHYSYELRIGTGPCDVIGLHRIIKERKPYRPICTRKCIMLQHGDAVGFEGAFLFGSQSAYVPDDYSFAVYLAEHEVDVWGIDQNWILVQPGVTDFTFMADWDMQDQIENLGIALGVARFTRLLTGSGFGKIHLLGYSSGVWTGYSYLNAETQKPEMCRHAKGFVAVDGFLVSDDPVMQATACAYYAETKAMLDAGMYQTDIPFGPIGYLAATDPGGNSPIVPGYSNHLVAMIFGAATHLFSPFTPWYHYLAGEFDENGIPVGFQFSTDAIWFDFLMTACAYEPNIFQADYLALVCGSPDMPHDDHIGDITVPVMNVSAAGGLGPLSGYTISLLGSTDVTNLHIQLLPDGYAVADFGHIDIFIGDNAEALVWQPVMEWIDAHSMKEESCGPKGRKF